MNNKILAILGTTVISLATIGGVAFASNESNVDIKDTKQIENNIKNNNEKKSNCHGSSKNKLKKMEKIMKDNGFEDVSKHMKSGDSKAMLDYMNNMTKEDYNKMIKIMNENGYEHMGKMMKIMGKKGIIKMHDTMSSMHDKSGHVKNMMNKF